MGAGQPSPQTFTSIDENELFWQRLVEEDQAVEAQARTGAVAESGSPAAKAAGEEELTFEEAVADLSAAVTAMPRLREMYLKLLEFCRSAVPSRRLSAKSKATRSFRTAPSRLTG